ncbi:Protein SIEVE ELEMENT OCCLUSION C [Glycine max]|nr:Protein SIEVE ELEMENT OCCLUSION C [Glycine max]
MQLLLDGINPLLAYWVEQGKNSCLYGSENLVWIQQFNDKIIEIKQPGLQLETIYVGNSQSSENVKQIMAKGGEKSLNDPLSFINVQHFWVQLETMRMSKLILGNTPSSDHVLAKLSTLLDMDDREEGWAVIGCRGDGILKEMFKVERKYNQFGALRNFLDPHFVERSCNHSHFFSSRENERPSEGNVMCQQCKRPMKNFVVYQP